MDNARIRQGELTIAPFSTDIKERNWTFNKSALDETDSAKPVVIDGRMWNKAKSGEEKDPHQNPFSLFWLVEQTDDSKKANLVVTHMKLDVALGATMPSQMKISCGDMHIALPVLINKSMIPANTRLWHLQASKLRALNKQALGDWGNTRMTRE